MTKPFKAGVTFGPDSLFERPALSVQIAAIAASWALVEDDLETLYAFLMSKWGAGLPKNGFLPTHPVAMLTFQTLQTINNRLDLLRAISEWALTPEEGDELRDEIIPLIRKRAKLRNGVVHAIWGTSADEPNALIKVQRYSDHLAYSGPDFASIRSHISDARARISGFQKRVIRRVETHGWRFPEPSGLDTPQTVGEDQ